MEHEFQYSADAKLCANCEQKFELLGKYEQLYFANIPLSDHCRSTIMWLLNTSNLELEFYEGSIAPPYAILSHVWVKDELTYQEMRNLDESVRLKAGFRKVENFCKVAVAMYDLGHAWVDTCCINKESSAELSEAINSMYNWYRNAARCIVYLADVPGSGGDSTNSPSSISLFRLSRWFTRGWTLQELIACSERSFFTQDWKQLEVNGWDRSPIQVISDVTKIDAAILRDSTELRKTCVATRMSWAAHRKTTRPEDMAYCLMGIFNVNMAILYGEGLHSAFRRLQDEILKTSFDQTLFAWRSNCESSGLFAQSPQDFAFTPQLGLWAPISLAPTTSTNIGTLFRPCLLPSTEVEKAAGIVRAVLQCDSNVDGTWMGLALRLRLYDHAMCFAYGQKRQAYRRVDCDVWDNVPENLKHGMEFRDVLVLENQNFDLVETAIDHHNAKWSALAKPHRMISK